jgi:predicted Zn-dependent protease
MARSRTVFDINPDYAVALTWAGETLVEMDSLPQAIVMHRRLLSLSDSSGLNIATLARTLALAGERTEAMRLLDILRARDARQRYVPSYDVAKVYVALGRNADAFAWLEKARLQRSHSMVFLKVDPAFRRLHRDPAFARLVAKVVPG